ncbi:hypothetical protein [Persicirhabdus sediminis]|uniref:PEP-CTERM protein-sorting domain-containing protein n=1 Tax=Persicirhabdus sediminis TaxID=454144 RepID=A0A8J7SM46_9BACT|nr:hypothetical protein [Persicirhabdus sediminis]MBK1792746.1 hypothetical protein [Persicirhabdus sediminis]
MNKQLPSCLLALFCASTSHASIINMSGITVYDTANNNAQLNSEFFYEAGNNPNPDLYRNTIQNAIFTTNVDDGSSGSGTYRDLYRLSDSGNNNNGAVVSGYNREDGANTVFDTQSPNGFFPGLTIGEMQMKDINGTFYVEFAIDLNEPGNGSVEYISLDRFGIYLSNSAAPELTDNSHNSLAALGTLAWNLDGLAGDDPATSVLLPASGGSGTDDLIISIPAMVFSGWDSSTHVTVFSEFGGVGERFSENSNGNQLLDFGTNGGGNEDVAFAKGIDNNNLLLDGYRPLEDIDAVPEVSSSLLSLLGLGLLMRRRR